ncbi:MAG: HigA family addiction module antidote protein [Planctomycetes bacterium]|nr:HigA family addiction module antidote protein [Planctomycetota bacterium]
MIGTPHAAGLTRVALSRHLGVPIRRVNEIVSGKRGITPETSWLFASAFGTTPEFWVNAQAACDLARSRAHRTIKRVGATG